MADRLTTEQRRKNMQAVKSKDSLIEQKLRKTLWKSGYRYRKNYSKVTGKPDIVLPSLKIAIFCDSEFWHGHNWKKRKSDIKSNKAFWIKKIERNMERDSEVNKKLKKEGWTVIRFWGKQIEKNTDKCLNKIKEVIKKTKK
jgi:DNA mismatch endonuclease (patch repair protein)